MAGVAAPGRATVSVCDCIDVDELCMMIENIKREWRVVEKALEVAQKLEDKSSWGARKHLRAGLEKIVDMLETRTAIPVIIADVPAAYPVLVITPPNTVELYYNKWWKVGLKKHGQGLVMLFTRMIYRHGYWLEREVHFRGKCKCNRDGSYELELVATNSD